MNKKILISLFLLTIFCVASVFAQEKTVDKEKLSLVSENQWQLSVNKDFRNTEIKDKISLKSF